MNREAIGLVLATLIGTLSLAACNKSEPPRSPPEQSRTAPPVPGSGAPVPQVALGTSSAVERKDGGTPPVQGQVDPKEQAQRRDFEPKR